MIYKNIINKQLPCKSNKLYFLHQRSKKLNSCKTNPSKFLSLDPFPLPNFVNIRFKNLKKYTIPILNVGSCRIVAKSPLVRICQEPCDDCVHMSTLSVRSVNILSSRLKDDLSPPGQGGGGGGTQFFILFILAQQKTFSTSPLKSPLKNACFHYSIFKPLLSRRLCVLVVAEL
jgi:hypothetical protein